jgi:hypothetical protein
MARIPFTKTTGKLGADIGISIKFIGKPNISDPYGGILTPYLKEQIRLNLLRYLDAYGNATKKALEMTTENWENEKPEWVKRVNTDINKFGVSVSASTVYELGARKWFWLDKGTLVRWAVMGSDNPDGLFWPKTSRGVFGSRNIAGNKTLIKGTGAMTAARIASRPGIEGRFWTNKLTSRLKDTYSNDIQQAITAAIFGLKGPKRIINIKI